MNTQKVTFSLVATTVLLTATASFALEAKFQNASDKAITISVNSNHCVTYKPDDARVTIAPKSSILINLGDRNDFECSTHYSLGWVITAHYEPLKSDIAVGKVSFDYHSGPGHFGASGQEDTTWPGVVGADAYICYKTSSGYNIWGDATATYTFGPKFTDWACAPSVSGN